MSTLNEIIAAWRNTNQKNDGIMSKLTINGSLYDIKDPAVEALASEIETRLASVEGRSWDAVTKGADQPKYATSVTQSTDGSITVEYGSLRPEALNVTASNGVFITGVSQATDGVVSVSTGSVEAQYVGFTGGEGWNSTDAQNAIKEALSKAIGATGDAATVATIQGAKTYAKDLVDALAGADVAANAQLIQKIIQELEGSTDATAWVTLVDKLHGLATGQTVIQYVDTAVAGASEAAANAIAALDATETSTNGTNVQVQVTQADGKITGVSITTDNTINAGDLSTALASAIGNIGATDVKGYVDAKVAGASTDIAALTTQVAGLSTDLAALTTDIVNNEQVVATALNDLNTNKADKSAFATGAAVVGLTTAFATDSGTLTITTATGAVWIPA